MTDWRTLRPAVMQRDGWACVAPVIDAECGPCGTRWGDAHPTRLPPAWALRVLELDHVNDNWVMKYGMRIAGAVLGKRAPDTPEHLATLCGRHHHEGWATSHRPELRTYIAVANGLAAEEG